MAPVIGTDDNSQPPVDLMLWRHLKSVLQFLQSNHYPQISNPSPSKKRASVALILRFRPSNAHPAVFNPSKCGVSAGSRRQRVDNYFSQPWVQEGEPEILFIKRAARVGDRWASHVAFPGGGRELSDKDDCATSVRETQEEIGIDLNADHCTLIGNLPELLVTTWWSKDPLMVLCPYVHLVMRYDLPPMTLQSAEVKSVHWVSLRALISPYLKTLERQDVSDRFFGQGNRLTRRILQAAVGKLLFTARTLVPTESYYSRSLSEYLPMEPPRRSRIQFIISHLHRVWQGPQSPALSQDQPLILWGLTYGILANFLGLMPTSHPANMWDWPTLSPWDIRFAVWAFTHRFRARKLETCIQRREAAGGPGKDNAEICGLDTQTFTASDIHQSDGPDSLDIVTEMLDGYFDRLRTAMWIALGFRLGVGILIGALLVRRWRRSHSYPL